MDYPKLPSQVRHLNRHLITHFGVETESTNAMWRVCWSNDQYENREDSVTEAGVYLLFPQVMLLSKYPWAKNKWMLENLVLVPEFQQCELGGSRKSYECIHAFKENVIPSFEACKFLVDLINAAKGKSPMPKYVDPDEKNPLEAQEKRIDKLVEELFGDESNLLGRTVTGQAIIVPRNYGDTK